MEIQRPTDAALAAHRTIEITTTGRRSGELRRIEIWWFYVEGRFFITGPPGARDWYANVNGHPNVIIHVGGHDPEILQADFARDQPSHHLGLRYRSLASLGRTDAGRPVLAHILRDRRGIGRHRASFGCE